MLDNPDDFNSIFSHEVRFHNKTLVSPKVFTEIFGYCWKKLPRQIQNLPGIFWLNNVPDFWCSFCQYIHTVQVHAELQNVKIFTQPSRRPSIWHLWIDFSTFRFRVTGVFVRVTLRRSKKSCLTSLWAGLSGIPGIPGSRDLRLMKIPGFLEMKSRDFSGFCAG